MGKTDKDKTEDKDACIGCDVCGGGFVERHVPPGDMLWDYGAIARYMGLSPFTVRTKVVTRKGFPQPFIPTGGTDGVRRYFANEVISFAREHRQ